jgi:hypothetical protein
MKGFAVFEAGVLILVVHLGQLALACLLGACQVMTVRRLIDGNSATGGMTDNGDDGGIRDS